MKCVKLTDGEIKRVSDTVADEMVAKKRATFTNKTEWKKATRVVKVEKTESK